MIRFDRIPEHFENIWLIWCHKLCTWIFIINQHFLVIQLLTSILASEVVEKNIFVLGIFCYLIWLNLVSRAKIKFFYNFTNYLEPPRSLKIVQIKFSHIKWLKMLKTTTSVWFSTKRWLNLKIQVICDIKVGGAMSNLITLLGVLINDSTN